MNTKRSSEIVSRFRERAWEPTRVSTIWRGNLPGTPEEAFPLLCPTREADWLPGWNAELIFTASGYAEKDCVFKTGPQGRVGDGVWVFAAHDPPTKVEIVRFTEDILFQIRACLEPVGESESALTWEYVLTALTESGAALLEGQDAALEAKAANLGAAMSHYLRTGEMIPAR
jgi:hypothetical protein